MATQANGNAESARLGGRRRRWLIGAGGGLALYAVTGMFIVPRVLEKSAVETVRDVYGAELRIENLSINPFTLTLRCEGLALDDPGGQALARLNELFLNFQSTSLFRWAWTFEEIRFDRPELFVRRDESGGFNFEFLAGGETSPTPAPEEGGGDPPRLIVGDFSIADAVVRWDDRWPPDPVDTTFGPIDIQVLSLTTLPEQSGEQDVVIQTETQGTLAWSGTLELNPLRSAGRASIRGSHVELLSAYIRHETGIDVSRGDADVGLAYVVDTRPDGSLAARVDDFELVLSDLQVRSFNAGNPTDREPRDLLSVPRLAIGGGAVRWPERELSVASVAIDDAVIEILRDAAGRLDLLPPREAPQEPQPQTEPGTAAAPGEPWSFTLDRFDIRRTAIGWLDESPEAPAELRVEDLALTVSGISNAPGSRFPVSLALRSSAGGRVQVDGGLTVLPEPVAEFDVSVEALSLLPLDPYLRTAADVSLGSGSVDFSGALASNPDDALSVTGDASIADFLIAETDEGSRLGSWDRFAVENLALGLADERLEISELIVDGLYADIFIAADGSVNLGRISKDAAAEPAELAELADTGASDAAAESGLDVAIGRVVINEAAADFADQSLPLPFEARISSLNGQLSTIATDSAEPAEIGLEGKVDEFGQVSVTGSLSPLEPKLETDISVEFENVDVPKFSAYTIRFAGREIAAGRLDLDLRYRLQASELVGENNIVLRDFELGDDVPHPDAMSLPLGLAVALLKDPGGRINVDLPVRGNVDDPEFRIGGLIGKALVNLIVKIVASPFALLGNLVGIEPSELESIQFPPGRAELAPPGRETAAKLAEALALRPTLLLEIPGAYAAEADGLALRTMAVDARIEAGVAERSAGGDDGGQFANLRLETLEALFAGMPGAEQAGGTLVEIRDSHVVPPDDAPDARPELDALAYAADLRQRLIDAETLPADALDALARARAASLRRAILATDPDLEPRVVIDATDEVALRDRRVEMKVRLEAS